MCPITWRTACWRRTGSGTVSPSPIWRRPSAQTVSMPSPTGAMRRRRQSAWCSAIRPSRCSSPLATRPAWRRSSQRWTCRKRPSSRCRSRICPRWRRLVKRAERVERTARVGEAEVIRSLMELRQRLADVVVQLHGRRLRLGAVREREEHDGSCLARPAPTHCATPLRGSTCGNSPAT